MSSSDNIHGHTPPQTAGEFLLTANATLAERGKQYDAGGKQERSMGKAVAAFNAIHGSSFVHLTEAQGWAFMAILKLVRGAHKPHADSALDLVGYSALYAECVAGELAIAANSEKVQVAALMATINEVARYCPHCDAPNDITAGSCRACGYEWEDAGQHIAQGSSTARADCAIADLAAECANLRRALSQCSVEAATMARNCALTMPSAVDMEWLDAMKSSLEAVMALADSAYFNLTNTGHTS